MSRTALIAKNTLVQLAGRAAGTVLGLITLGVMTRYLGTSGYGAFTTVTTFLQFFGIVVDFGLSLATVAMLSEPGVDRDRIASNIFSLRVVSAAIFFALAPIAVLAFPYAPDVKRAVIVGAFSFFFIALNQVLTGILQKELKMARAAAAEILGRLGLLAGALVVASLGLPLEWMIGALIVGNGLTFLWEWLLVRKLVRIRWRAEMSVWKDIARRSWPIGVSIMFNLVYLKGDVIVLSLTRSQAEVGVYGAAYKILDVLTVIPIMFMGLVLPLLVKAWHGRDEADFRRVLQKAFDFMAVLALPVVAGIWATGPDLMRLFAGDGFGQAGLLLQILIVAAGAVFFGSMFGHAVIAVNRQRAMIWGYAADAILSTAGYLIFIPRAGAVGAAWVTVFSEAFIAVSTFLVVRQASHFSPRFITAAKAAAAALAMAMIVHALGGIHVLARVTIGAILYVILVFAFGAVTPATVKELLKKPETAVTA